MTTHKLTLPPGYGLVKLDEVNSTNAEALRRSALGEAGPLWVWADVQVAGRGRDGRNWLSEKGNLYATLLLPAGELSRSAELSFVTALAVYDGARASLPESECLSLSLKWPNDVLLAGQKTSGILLERQGDSSIAIGCGINLAHAPATQARYPATCLHTHGAQCGTLELLEQLAAAFDKWLVVWRTQGFEPVRAAWLARAHGVGQQIEARLPGKTLHGMFETLDEDGALVLKQACGQRTRILAADVFFPS